MPAFSELVERYQERLLRFLLARSVSRADAEDAMQDTFISAYRYLASFDPRWRFSTWIYRIAIRNAWRGARAAGMEELAAETADDAAGPLEECIANSERENMWLVARRRLSPDAYTAMWLRYVEDMPVRDIATALDKSLSWTKVTLLRARRRLSDAMAEQVPPGREPSTAPGRKSGRKPRRKRYG